MYRCSGCQKKFNSLTTFDDHRTGSFSKNERRCLSAEEMHAKGMAQDAAGKWRGQSDEQNRERLAQLRAKEKGTTTIPP